DIEVDEHARLTEGEILYLADKLVSEDKVIPIEQRFGQSVGKYNDNPEALKKIENRRDAVYKIMKKIEGATGRGFIYG
ncbi:MAG: phosphohydrolase, partial [Firmicutes bacterium]|nr:phosphohydrolase [Bacillota bacterium]